MARRSSPAASTSRRRLRRTTRRTCSSRQHSQPYVGRGVRSHRRVLMRRSRGIIGWLPLVLLTACVASYPGEHQAGMIQPAVDRLLTRGDIEVAQTHLRAVGFDPGPIDGIYTAQTQAAVRAFQATYGFSVSGLLYIQKSESVNGGR